MHNKLRITRYNKTRYWAIWANEELLAVTVYMKGAQAVLNYIHTIINPTTHNTTMAKTKSVNAAATATATADFDPTILKAVNGEGKTIRIKFDPLGVSVCYNLKGKWCAHEIYNQPLPELVAEGVFSIEDEDSRKTYDKYFNPGKKAKRTKTKRSKAKKLKKNAEPQAQEQETASVTIEEAPQTDAKTEEVEMVAAEINEEVEAALWQEIEEAREQERFMEAQDAEEESIEESATTEPESNEAVTDVEPTAEAPAQESAAEAAEPQPLTTKPAQHKTCNVVLNGEEQARAIPEGYVPGAGDRLIRNYKNEVVEVFVKVKGQYEWNGEVYPTLTHISWKVAGYQISGNTFFGLPIKPRKG